MKDGLGRDLTYLRISVTDRCNLRCRYCMPEGGVERVSHSEILTFEEIERLTRIFAALGIRRIRLTGGEPLARQEIPLLAERLTAIHGIEFLGITTNGVMLTQAAEALARAGVQGLNISMDTADRMRYAALTRRDVLPAVLEGVRRALELPFQLVKLNCVLWPESTEADWLSVAALAENLPLTVRFIEWMPMAGESGTVIPASTALAAVAARYGALCEMESPVEGGPARCYSADGLTGTVGAISAISHSFCGSCNRLRLTAAGDLRLCLFSEIGISLRPLLRGGADDSDIAAAILDAVARKPAQHGGVRPDRMYGIGG